MGRRYLTIAQYSDKYKVPKPTIYNWAKTGRIHLDRTSYPARIADDGPTPKKGSENHKWRYIFV